MNNEQEKLIRAIADRGDTGNPLTMRMATAALAQVVLELAGAKDRPAIPLIREGGPARTPLRDQMKAVLVHENMNPSAAERVLDELFDVLEQDPGHDATSYDTAPGCDRTATVESYQSVIQAIRRGE